MLKCLNQNKPNHTSADHLSLLAAPLNQIEPHIRQLWKACLTDKQIVAEIRKHIDTNEYGIGLTKFVAICKELGLYHTRQQGHTPDSIQDVMVGMRNMYPNAGVREMIGLLFHEHDMAVSRSIMQAYFLTYEPHLLRQRKANCLQHRRFWAAGFGLALHTGIEPFSGHILWMKVWHSNRNPQLILSYYLETVEGCGHIPMVTQSDPGTENFGIANPQTLLRQMHDPTLNGFAGWYDPDNTLQLMVFHWVFIPWLQVELNNYQDRINNSRKRHDRKKVLPHGIPELIYTCAQDYGALDFKVMVSPAAVNQIRQLYINANHVVFNLVPPSLNTFFERCYHQLCCPPIGRSTAWTVYHDLLSLVHLCEGIPAILTAIEGHDTADNELHLLPGLRDLHETEGYMGGVANDLGLQAQHIQAMNELSNDEPEIDNAIDAAPSLLVAQFSSDDEDEEADELSFTNPMASNYYWAVIGKANNSARVYGADDCPFIACGRGSPPLPLAIQYEAGFYAVIIGAPPGIHRTAASAARAEGTFKASFMIVKGIAHHMPPLFTSTETVRSTTQNVVDSLGQQLRSSLNISPLTPQPSSTSMSRTLLLNSPQSTLMSTSRTSLPGTPTSHTSSFSQISAAPPSTTMLARTELPTSQTEPSPIIYSHVRNLRGIISSHYYPTSTTHIRNLARPLGDLAARYLASHGYNAEVVNLIIEARGRVHSSEQLVTFLARRGMAVNEAKFLLVLINHDMG
ncbi:hypothetical protein V8B97DRAFT_2102577 [Scleroderma yunnanense]